GLQPGLQPGVRGVLQPLTPGFTGADVFKGRVQARPDVLESPLLGIKIPPRSVMPAHDLRLGRRWAGLHTRNYRDQSAGVRTQVAPAGITNEGPATRWTVDRPARCRGGDAARAEPAWVSLAHEPGGHLPGVGARSR